MNKRLKRALHSRRYQMANTQMKNVIIEMQIKTTVRKYYAPTRMAEIKKTSKDVEQTATLITSREVTFLQLF